MVRRILLILMVLFLSGCAYYSVRHLSRQPWEAGTKQSLTMDYWTFHYQSSQTAEGLMVKGYAEPNRTNIPEWAVWVDDLWMAAYLSDNKGEVIGRALAVFPQQDLTGKSGIPFSFTIVPEKIGSPGGTFISFGYRMVLTREKLLPGTKFENLPNDPELVFFANEQALTRY